jgi:hypothetical protein
MLNFNLQRDRFELLQCSSLKKACYSILFTIALAVTSNPLPIMENPMDTPPIETMNPLMIEDGGTESESEEEVDELENDDGVISGSFPPIGAAFVNLSNTPTVVVNCDGWPVWIREWHGVFSEKNFGSLWAALVDRWTVVERSYKWASPVSLCPPSV